MRSSAKRARTDRYSTVGFASFGGPIADPLYASLLAAGQEQPEALVDQRRADADGLSDVRVRHRVPLRLEHEVIKAVENTAASSNLISFIGASTRAAFAPFEQHCREFTAGREARREKEAPPL